MSDILCEWRCFLALNLVNILAGVLVALRFLDNLFTGAF